MPFTPEELAEMAAADAEIEASFRLTNEDLNRSRAMDREAVVASMPPEKRKLAAKNRAYYEANREKLAAKNRAYYEANREKLAAKNRAYREANREKVAAQKRAYYEANREKVAAQKRAYREANREKVAAQKRAYYEANREKLAAKNRAYYEANREVNRSAAHAIKVARKANGYTQKDLAQLLGVSQPCISAWEAGIVPPDLEKLAAVFPELENKKALA